jgi:hypothetical protein
VKIDQDDMITQAEAARIRGVSHEAIRYLVRMERVEVHRIAGKVFISRKSIEAYQPSVGGRPRKKKPARKSRQKK